jgi:hypothetical protein
MNSDRGFYWENQDYQERESDGSMVAGAPDGLIRFFGLWIAKKSE